MRAFAVARKFYGRSDRSGNEGKIGKLMAGSSHMGTRARWGQG